jgi:6-phosphogluconolactonase
MKFDAAKGVLSRVQTVPTIPEGFKGTSHTAEVVVHPNGKFVYGSNRGHNSIAVFTFDESKGELTPVQHQGQNIKTPRNFNVDLTGNFLLVGNQDSGSIIVFRIDLKTGKLEPTGESAAVGSPVCLRMMYVTP